MSGAFKSPGDLFNDAFEFLADKEFDTMIGTGLSGSLIIPVLAREFGSDFNWAIIRKDPGSSHASTELEGYIGKRWIFVDDLIDSGATLKRVKQVVADRCKANSYWDGHKTEYVGTYLYHTRRWYPADHQVGYYVNCRCLTCDALESRRYSY